MDNRISFSMFQLTTLLINWGWQVQFSFVSSVQLSVSVNREAPVSCSAINQSSAVQCRVLSALLCCDCLTAPWSSPLLVFWSGKCSKLLAGKISPHLNSNFQIDIVGQSWTSRTSPWLVLRHYGTVLTGILVQWEGFYFVKIFLNCCTGPGLVLPLIKSLLLFPAVSFHCRITSLVSEITKADLRFEHNTRNIKSVGWWVLMLVLVFVLVLDISEETQQTESKPGSASLVAWLASAEGDPAFSPQHRGAGKDTRTDRGSGLRIMIIVIIVVLVYNSRVFYYYFFLMKWLVNTTVNTPEFWLNLIKANIIVFLVRVVFFGLTFPPTHSPAPVSTLIGWNINHGGFYCPAVFSR